MLGIVLHRCRLSYTAGTGGRRPVVMEKGRRVRPRRWDSYRRERT
jgi:hypothetical protein